MPHHQQPHHHQQQQRQVKMVAVGDGGAGKTCLLTTFATGRFPAEYAPTVFDNFEASAVAGGASVRLSLWDTAGQEDYDQLRPLSYPGADVFLVCFSVGSRASFENARRKWSAEVRRHAPVARLLLVGNKADLRADGGCRRHLRTHGQTLVDRREAEAAAREMKAAAYVENSALMGSGVHQVFEVATMAALLPSAMKNGRSRRSASEGSRRRCSMQ